MKELLAIVTVMLLAGAAVEGCRYATRRAGIWWHTNDFGLIWSEDGTLRDPADSDSDETNSNDAQ